MDSYATHKWLSEGFARPRPDGIKMDPEVKKKVDAMWKQLGCSGGVPTAGELWEQPQGWLRPGSHDQGLSDRGLLTSTKTHGQSNYG